VCGHRAFTSPVQPFFGNISDNGIKGFVFEHRSDVYMFISAAVNPIIIIIIGWFFVGTCQSNNHNYYWLVFCRDLKVEQPCQAGGLCNPNQKRDDQSHGMPIQTKETNSKPIQTNSNQRTRDQFHGMPNQTKETNSKPIQTNPNHRTRDQFHGMPMRVEILIPHRVFRPCTLLPPPS